MTLAERAKLIILLASPAIGVGFVEKEVIHVSLSLARDKFAG